MMISCCGLNCSKCECYIATQEDDDEKRSEVAKKWSIRYQSDIRPEQINCDGCRAAGRKFDFTEKICPIRKCCYLKGVENCAVCDEYICDALADFIQMAPKTGVALEKLR